MTAQGTAAIRFIVLVGGLLLYVYLYGTFLKEIWDARAGETVDLNNQDVQIASAIGGALAAVFASLSGSSARTPT